ncbi:MAG: hypothetical protein WKF77_12540 [Planctomycetaceae bacterium]
MKWATTTTRKCETGSVYFFLIGFPVCFLPEAADFPSAGVAFFLTVEFVALALGRVLELDFDAEGALAFETGIGIFLEADAAGFVAGADFPEVPVVLAGGTDFEGAGNLGGADVFVFLTGSDFSGRETSFAASGLFGFLFGGSCSSAKRSITSAMHCSVSA